MKTRRFIILLAAMSGVLGCVRQLESEDQPEGSVIFKAVNGDNLETKTVLQSDGTIMWSEADEINLFYGSAHSTKFTSTNTSPASEAEFKGSLDGFEYNETDSFWATYPYNEANTCDGSSVTVTLPAEQTAVAGTFADDLFISVAKTKDFNLRFFNVCGGIKFSVTTEGVRSVVFKGKGGEVLAGTAKVSFGEDGKPLVREVTNPKTEIKVSAPEGASFEVGKWYYLVSLPVSLQNGFFFTLEKPNGSMATKEYDKAVAVKRSIWGVLKDSDGTLEYSEIDADQTLYEVSAAGGPVELAVQTNVETEVTMNVEWMHYIETKALSSKTVVLSVDTNESTASREGTVTIKQQNSSLKQTITVRQAGWIAATSIKLDKTTLNLYEGREECLIATIIPDNSMDKVVNWSSSNPEIASVDETGKVTAIKKGNATITAMVADKKATCTIEVCAAPNAIDLGIVMTREDGSTYRLLWADCEIFGYYAWGETESKSIYSWSNYKWANGEKDKLTKYCYSDGKTMLDPEDDVAHVKLGGKWRMPTCDEWKYLLTKCSVGWSSQYRGLSISNNGKSIFLGVTGYKYDYYLADLASLIVLRSSSLDAENRSCSSSLYAHSGSRNIISMSRSTGQKVRPVMEVEIPIVSIELNETSLLIELGKSATLVATVMLQDNTTSNTVIWSTSDSSIATVDSKGNVTAVKKGTATITARAGEQRATCSVTVKIDTPDAVDLGLSVKWGSFNVGASSPEEYGAYFAWGETEPKLDCINSSYKWSNGAINKLTKYCPTNKTNYWDGIGNPDGKTVLDPEDDVAYVNLGNKWRMPTYAEWAELLDSCTWTWTTLNGVSVRQVTSKKNGNSIFLPEAGEWYNSHIVNAGHYGYYWSSSLYTNDPRLAWSMIIGSTNDLLKHDQYRYAGHSVRPVSE